MFHYIWCECSTPFNIQEVSRYENIIFTSNSAEAHKTLPLRTAGGMGGSERQKGRRINIICEVDSWEFQFQVQ